MLQPIVRLTLFCGLGHSEFAAAVKRVFIEVASDEYSVRGRPANVARVATQTGLPRKVIQKYRTDRARVDSASNEPASPLNAIIHYWRFDSRFSESPGVPKDLAYEGKNSFTHLAKSYAGDIPVTTIRQELLREGIAVQSNNGKLRLVREYSFPERLDENFLRNAAFAINHHAESVVHNARLVAEKRASPDTHERDGRFERLVWSRDLNEAAVLRFQRWVRQTGQIFIENSEKEISRLEQENLSSSTPGAKLAGVGVYFFKT